MHYRDYDSTLRIASRRHCSLDLADTGSMAGELHHEQRNDSTLRLDFTALEDCRRTCTSRPGHCCSLPANRETISASLHETLRGRNRFRSALVSSRMLYKCHEYLKLCESAARRMQQEFVSLG